MPIDAVLFDLDGTLVDSNELHVEAWDAAFRSQGHAIERAAIRGQIGKGGDLLVPALLPDLDDAAAEDLATRHGEIFQARFLFTVQPFAQAHALLARLHGDGKRLVLASSAAQKELDHYVELLDAGDLIAATTSIDDVATSKPAGDIFATALKKLGDPDPATVLVVGDTPYDVEAARKCGLATIGVRSGGFDDGALTRAGAIALYDDVAALLARYDGSPLAG